MRAEPFQSVLAVLLLTGILSAQQSSSKPQSEQSAPASPAKTNDNPFPEDVSRKAANAAKQQQNAKPETPATAIAPEAPAAGESSSDTGYKAPEDDSEASPQNPQRRRLRLDGDSAIGTPHADRLALKDEEVADLYFKDGNYQGALNRYQHALHLVPDDELAAYGIAESARKLGKRDQALEAYKSYLKLAPQGKKAKQARKAIEELSASAKH
jgi:tetratricopeptide (TPR) repeat protein